MLKVAKFGGSSMADAKQFEKVRSIVRADPARKVIVVSAAGKRSADDHKLTDLLYLCYAHLQYGVSCDAIFQMIADRYIAIRDECGLHVDIEAELAVLRRQMRAGISEEELVSRGEYFSALLMADYLGYSFLDAELWVRFRFDGSIDKEASYAALRRLADGRNVVIPGFYGVTPDRKIRTFSRGGSDITGAVVARAIDAELYENWTDVSGFLMADPRIVPNPRGIREMTYQELRELSYMGATVLHEESIFPVRVAGIPTQIKNTNDPSHPGTMILARPSKDGGVITGIAGHKNFTLISIEKGMMNAERGFGRRVLQVLDDFDISFEHLPTGIDTMSVVISTEELSTRRGEILKRLNEACQPDSIEMTDGIALIATVGHGMVRNPGTAARLFAALDRAHVNVRMIDQGSSELNIIVGVDSADFETAVRAIYGAFEKNGE